MSVSTIKIVGLLFVLLLIQLLPGCVKDDQPEISLKKIVFKAEASSGVAVNMIVYGYDAKLTTISKAGVQTWTSPEITIPREANVATITANAMGTESSSTLTVQIFENGILKTEGRSTGTALSANARLNLK